MLKTDFTSFAQLLKTLNEGQRQAVESIFGPLMILAGPGTGKTQLLAVRTANILRTTDLYPSNILILTYTNAGVKAMRERLATIIGRNGYEVVVETFHGFANSLITESDEAATLKGEKIQMTDLERIYLEEYLLDHTEGLGAIRNSNAPYYYRKALADNISILKREGVTPEKFSDFIKNLTEENAKLKAMAIFYDAYEKSKAPNAKIPFLDRRGRYDYDDMIILATEILKNEPELLAKTREQFQFVMVDEFQDTNGAQLGLLQIISSDADSNVCVVGDDDQSIYRFQGASVRNFQVFSEKYENPKSVVLEKNYRSRSEIVEKSSEMIRLIPLDQRVMDKKLESVRGKGGEIRSHRFGTLEEELSFIIQDIKKIPPKNWNDTAVLVRTRKQADEVIAAFLQAGLPYTTDGKEDIRSEARIQELMKVLRFAGMTLHFEAKELLIFEILLCDFWNIEHHDLMLLTTFVHQKRNEAKKKWKESMALDIEAPQKQDPEGISLFSELFLRFPEPQRVTHHEDDGPTPEESQALSIVQELSFKNPYALHKASWALKRLSRKAVATPVHDLMMEFLRDSGIIDFILKKYEHDEVVRLRDLRSIGSFVENLKKGSHVSPGILIHQYLRDLDQLERHGIVLQGALVSSHQNGIRILTAHGSKGLEFEHVYIPFCLEGHWPKNYRRVRIALPCELLGQESASSKEEQKLLHNFDESRLFYVAMTRAKDRLVFTGSPHDKKIISRFLEGVGLAAKTPTAMDEASTLIRLLKKIPQPDPVEASKETLAGLVEEISLSPSSLNRYLTCPRQFLYQHLLKTPQPKRPSLVYGQCIHKALEKSYRRLMKEGAFPHLPYFQDQFLQELEWQGVDQGIRQSCLSKFEHAKKWYQRMYDQGAITPLELERNLTRKMEDGLIFTGKFDKVEPIRSGSEVQIVDYKTGEPDQHVKSLQKSTDIFSPDTDDYLRQLVAYKMLYESGYRRRAVTTGQLVFLDPVKKTVKKYGLEEGTFTNVAIPLTQDMVKKFEQLLLETWKKIKALDFHRLETYDPKKCDYCPYKNVCWKN